jgi:hypothetical protein
VLLAILCWSIQNRRFRLLISAATTIGAVLLTALLADHAILHYLHDVYGPAIETQCGAGGALRMIFGTQYRWLQYVPCIFGGLWFIRYWNRNRRHWDWTTHLPLLLIVSVASSPYFWFHDFTLALPAFVALALRGLWHSVGAAVLWLLVQAAIIVAPGGKPGQAVASLLWIGFWILVSSQRLNKEEATVPVAVASAVR